MLSKGAPFTSVLLCHAHCGDDGTHICISLLMGQVFCHKRDPNCRACPLSGACEYARSNGRHNSKRQQPSPAQQRATPAQQHQQSPAQRHAGMQGAVADERSESSAADEKETVEQPPKLCAAPDDAIPTPVGARAANDNVAGVEAACLAPGEQEHVCTEDCSPSHAGKHASACHTSAAGAAAAHAGSPSSTCDGCKPRQGSCAADLPSGGVDCGATGAGRAACTDMEDCGSSIRPKASWMQSRHILRILEQGQQLETSLANDAEVSSHDSCTR